MVAGLELVLVGRAHDLKLRSLQAYGFGPGVRAIPKARILYPTPYI